MPEVIRKQRRPQPASAADWALFAFVNLFGRPDPAEGARIAGYRLVRGDDGALYAGSEPDATTPRASDD